MKFPFSPKPRSASLLPPELEAALLRLKTIEGAQVRFLKEQARLAERAYERRWAGDVAGGQLLAEKMLKSSENQAKLQAEHEEASDLVIRLQSAVA